MKITSIEGLVLVDVPGLDKPLAGIISSDINVGARIDVTPTTKFEQTALHNAIADGKVQSVQLLRDDIFHLTPPSDTTMYAALMDQVDIKEFRMDRFTAMSIEGGVEFFLDEATQQYVVRRVQG